MARAHVIGAGLAGLAAALALQDAGLPVVLHEAAPQPGGRCRSFPDRGLEATLDNGTHVLVGANRRARALLARLGTLDGLEPLGSLPFLDLRDGTLWHLPPGWRGLLAVPGVGWRALRGGLALALAGQGATVQGRLGADAMAFARLWRPLAIAVLNTPPEAASARLLAHVLRLTLLAGPAAGRVHLPRRGLGEMFVAPAVDAIVAGGGELRLGRRLQALDMGASRVGALVFAGERLRLRRDDVVVLAVPWYAAARLVPGLATPEGAHAIVNLHLRLPDRVELPGGGVVLGLVGSRSEWLFARDGIASLTVSAADDLLAVAPAVLARRLWGEVAPLLGRAGAPLPPWRLVKERRATFAQTPAQLARRPGPATAWENLVLAGDWTRTGLPATIEGAVLSGERAAALALRRARASNSPADGVSSRPVPTPEATNDTPTDR